MERMGIGLALIVALCWGSADIVATVAARRQGTFVTTLLSFIMSSIILIGFGLFAVPQLPGTRGFLPTLPELGLTLLTGLLTAVAYVSLYRGLALGPMAIVSPLISSDGVVGALLAVVFLQNTLSLWQTCMIIVVFVGLICASFDATEARMIVKAGGTHPFFKGGIGWGLLAMLSFGAMLFSIGLLSATWGWYWPILFIRTTATLTLSFFALWRALRLRRAEKIILGTPTKRTQLTLKGIGLAMLVGLLEMTGLLIYSLDTQLASTSLAAALSSSWGIIPLFAGIVFFRERLPMQQLCGIVLVVGGLFLLAVKPI